MTDDDRRTNETIAKACGYTWRRTLEDGAYTYFFAGPGSTLWEFCQGPTPEEVAAWGGYDSNLFRGSFALCPDYLADPARLPEMWALCREKGQNHGCTYNDSEGAYIAFVYYDGPRDWAMMRPKKTAADDDPQRAFARALADALESEEGG